jgi:hypothetical protein
MLGDYIIGGITGFGRFASLSRNGNVVAMGYPDPVNGRAGVYSYSEETDAWSPLGQFFSGNQFLAGALNPDAAYFAGVFLTLTSTFDEEITAIWVYNLVGDTWVQVGPDVPGPHTYSPKLALSGNGLTFSVGYPSLTASTFPGLVYTYKLEAGHRAAVLLGMPTEKLLEAALHSPVMHPCWL